MSTDLFGDLMVALGYLNSASCLVLLACCFVLSVRMPRHWRTVLALWPTSVMLAVQATTPWVPALPVVAWSGCVMHTLFAIVAVGYCRAELWALLRLKFDVPAVQEHPWRRRDDSTILFSDTNLPRVNL